MSLSSKLVLFNHTLSQTKNIKRQKEARKEGEEKEGEGRGYEKKGGREGKKIEKSF